MQYAIYLEQSEVHDIFDKHETNMEYFENVMEDPIINVVEDFEKGWEK